MEKEIFQRLKEETEEILFCNKKFDVNKNRNRIILKSKEKGNLQKNNSTSSCQIHNNSNKNLNKEINDNNSYIYTNFTKEIFHRPNFKSKINTTDYKNLKIIKYNKLKYIPDDINNFKCSYAQYNLNINCESKNDKKENSMYSINNTYNHNLRNVDKFKSKDIEQKILLNTNNNEYYKNSLLKEKSETEFYQTKNNKYSSFNKKDNNKNIQNEHLNELELNKINKGNNSIFNENSNFNNKNTIDQNKPNLVIREVSKSKKNRTISNNYNKNLSKEKLKDQTMDYFWICDKNELKTKEINKVNIFV